VYVERLNDGCGNGSPDNWTTDYWIVRVEGTTYRLGYKQDSEVYAKQGSNLLLCYDSYCSPDPNTYGATRWRVDKVTDPTGNQMAFTYREKEIEIEVTGPNVLVQRSMVTEIKYNDYDTNQWASKVVFLPVSNDVDDEGYMRIKRIDVYHLGERIRQVKLTTDLALWLTCGQTHSERALITIQEFSGDGTESMPAVNFGHKALPNFKDGCFPYRRVNKVNMQYGGRAILIYESDGRRYSGCWPDAGCLPVIGYSYRVAEIQTFDGLGGTPSRVTYDYGTRCYDQTNTNPASDGTNGGTTCRGANPSSRGPLVGHDWVTVTALDSAGTPVVKTTHDYNIDDYNSWRRGKEEDTQVYDGSGSLLQESVTTWAGNATFNYVSQVVSTDYTGGESISVKTTYAYDPALQGGAQYGNLTHVREYGDGDTPFRTTVTTYNPNTAPRVWIVGKPQEVKVYEGNVGGTLLSHAQIYYDYSDNLTTPPTLGLLTKAKQINPQDTSEVVETRSAYDAWGNVTDVWDPLNNHTGIVYDPVHHMYPVEATNALGHHRHVEYYDINATGSPTDGGLPGQVWKVWDDNGLDTATRYTYDSFGRLLKVIRPGDTMNLPTTELEYVEHGPGTLYPAGDFENGGWNLHGSGVTREYAVGQGMNGSTALKLQTAYEGDHWMGRGYGEEKKGTTYAFGAWVRGSGWVCLNVAAHSGHEESVACTNATPEWQFISGRIHLPDNATGIIILFRTGVGTVWIDDVMMGPSFAPLHVVTHQREVSGQAGTLDSYVYYDGLGRQIQGRSEAEDGQWTVASTGYDALGRAVQGYLPHFENGSAYSAPDGLHTLTSYDSLGRAIGVVNPDGATSGVFYSGLDTLAVDANGHVKASHSDVFSRMTAVDEALIGWSDDFDDGNLPAGDWTTGGSAIEGGGVLRVTGDGSWGTYVRRPSATVDEGQGVMFDFKYDAGTVAANSFLHSGTWDQANYRRWGIYVDSSTIYWDTYAGDASTHQYGPLLTPRGHVVSRAAQDRQRWRLYGSRVGAG
jgi:hypothetical protein